MQSNIWKNSVQDLPSFETEVKDFLKELNITPINLKIDHLGLKFDSQDAVNQVIESLKIENAIEISAVEMKERIFRLYKLTKPLIFLNQEIYFIELPDAKHNVKRNRKGFEHLEFYFDEDIYASEDLIKRFKKEFPNFKGEYNLNLPHVEGQTPNPTLEIEKKGSEMEIKFHAKHIKDIVNFI